MITKETTIGVLAFAFFVPSMVLMASYFVNPDNYNTPLMLGFTISMCVGFVAWWFVIIDKKKDGTEND